MNLMGRRTARMYAAEFANHTELLHQLSQRLGAVEQRFQQYEKDLSSQVERNYEEVGKQVEAHFSKLVAEVEAARSHFEQFKATRERVMRVERRLRRLLDGERPAIAAGAQPDEAPSSHTETADEFEYAGFEDHLRDSEVVKARQLRYVEHFAGQAPVLDIGCGKGEFLMLMREAGIEAGGIDLDLDMVLECRENGLKVERCDAIDYLERQPDESIGAIFSTQVIEHLTSAQLSRLVVLACRKLKPGGTMILETLNPESIFVQYRWFWMDPSHVRLVHPEMLRYLLESTGFTQSSCHYISPPPDVSKIPPLQIGTNGELEDFNRATAYLNRLLYGDQEYYIVARK
jgi:2-polyprenyl-3-methyl-5-hydroxy-6-metoxy-1,4-benzoquinol methylase